MNVKVLFSRFCEQLYKSLGFDWFLLFLGGNIHKETVIRGVRMLCHMLSEPSSLTKFQSGAANGFWLIGSEALTSKKTNIAAGKICYPLNELVTFQRKTMTQYLKVYDKCLNI